jgi:Flp pilus assembly protein TadD
MDAALEAGDAAGARVALDLVRARFPQDPLTFVAAGRLAIAEGNLGEADDQFRCALRLDPKVAEAHRKLADAVAMQGRLDEAVEWWRRWLKLGGQQEEAGAVAAVQRAVEAAETLRAYFEERHGE